MTEVYKTLGIAIALGAVAAGALTAGEPSLLTFAFENDVFAGSDANFDLRWRLRRSGSQWELQAMPSREDRSGSSRKLRLEPKDVPADALLHMLQANRQALADGSMDAIPVVFLPSTRRKVYHVETHTQKTSAGTLLKIDLYQRSWFWRRLQERTYIMELESGRFLRYAGPTQCPLPEDYVGDVHVRYQSLSSGGAN